MKIHLTCIKDIILSVNKNIRTPLGNTAILIQRIRDGKVAPNDLKNIYKKIASNIFLIDSYVSVIFHPYIDEIKNTSVISRLEAYKKKESKNT